MTTDRISESQPAPVSGRHGPLPLAPVIDVANGKGGRVAQTSVRALGCALLVLGACASDDPAPTQDARVQAFIDRYASVYCERVGACCGGNGRTPLDECVATARTYGSQVATPGLTFDQPSADACLASFDTYVCDAEHYRGPCHDVFRTAAFRTRQVDQSCETSSDCALPEKGGASCSNYRDQPRVCGTYYFQPDPTGFEKPIESPACR